MSPCLEDGDFGFLRKIGRQSDLKPGDVVLIRHARYGEIIKRVKSISSDYIEAEGVSAHSVSSEAMGRIEKRDILAKALWRISPAGVCRVSA